LSKGEVDFAASDMPLTNEEMASFPVKVQHIPSVIGGGVLTYRLGGQNGKQDGLAKLY
jgi:phosphate transport system substrate-binding protein